MNTDKLVVKALCDAPISNVWEFYTNPQHIEQWNHASEDWECYGTTNDLTVGGMIQSTMAAKDGSAKFQFSGTYSVVDKPHTLEYAMSDDRVVKVEFEEKNDKTQITVTFDPEDTNSLDVQTQGWQAILDNFVLYTQSNQ